MTVPKSAAEGEGEGEEEWGKGKPDSLSSSSVFLVVLFPLFCSLSRNCCLSLSLPSDMRVFVKPSFVARIIESLLLPREKDAGWRFANGAASRCGELKDFRRLAGRRAREFAISFFATHFCE